MNKRSHGEGSISKRSNGSWLAQVTIDGKRVSKTFRIRRDAQEWLNSMTKQVKQGLTFESTRTTVDELLATWLAMKLSNTRPSTGEQYSRIARLYISPALGDTKLQEITPLKLQTLYRDLENQGTGKRTIQLVHTVLHGFLKHAVQMGYVAQNWAALVEVPRPKKKEMAVWDETQVNQFLLTVQGDPFYRLAFATGMRRGELIGLQWKDVDFKASVIYIRRQVYRPEGGGFIFQEPKTYRGKRAVAIGPGMLNSLQKHYQATIPLMKAIAGDQWQDYDLVFPTSIGTPRHGYEVTKTFEDLAKRAGLPVIRFHDIRHTAASILLLKGEPSVRVAAILGQSIEVLHSTYAHYIRDNQERASMIMDELTTVTSIEISCNRLHQNSAIEHTEKALK